MERRAEDVGDGDVDLLPGYPIVMVENKKQLYELLDKLRAQEFIGIDSEWKPHVVLSESVALLQIAILDGVYLVDFCSRELKLTESDWDIFLQTLLCGPSIKVGFDLTNDLRALFGAASTANIQAVADNLCNVVCLKRLVENLLSVDRHFLGNQSHIEGGSDCDPDEDETVTHFKLSDLSKRLLDITLDKSEQRCNWSIRPLRQKQKSYAAMDAYIVIELYGELNKRAVARGLDFEKFVQQSVVDGRKRDKVRLRKERVKMDDMTWAEICDKLHDVQSGTRPATQLQCIVDSMLLGLGKHLRRCGVNVLIPGDRSELKMKARGNSRIIVTSGKAYDELRRQFADRVLAIPNASALGPIEQLKCVFAKNKVTFAGLDVFSRCMECNGTCFVQAPGPVIQALFENNVTCKNGFHDEPFNVVGWTERLSSLDCRDFSGIGCRLLPTNEGHMVVQCHGGIVYITANIVKHDHLEEGVDTMVRKLSDFLSVPEQVASRPGRVFYICGQCGKIYWEEQ
ncbi:3'-5' exonuclease [Ancylostoma caninum]|uniref:3'-5' exonuclease n=1 Tax=Ancylostoma caninum TaxID=29170 RepID=A0A368H5S0_ANCCA|nr:3'-5' exonuclease [Ancylostoma caninum]